MEQIRKQIESFSLSLPCVGVVTYEKIVDDFANYFNNTSYHQGYHKITTL